MNRVNVLYVHQDGVLSGSALSLRNLIATLDRSRFSPSVVMCREGPTRQLFEAANAPIHVIDTRGFWIAPGFSWYEPDYHRNWLALLPNKDLLNYLASNRPDLVHINDKTVLSAGIAAHKLRIPVVWHLRSAYAYGKSRLQRTISRSIIRRVASALVAISEDETDGFEECRNLTIIQNSVDIKSAEQAIARRQQTRLELGLRPDQIAVGMVGLLNQRKGAWDFIKAAGEVLRMTGSEAWRFVVIAPIPDRESFNTGIRGKLGLIDNTHPEDLAWQIARGSGVDKFLTLTGRRPDVLNVLAALDIGVVYYRLPAIGRPAFEAMSVGLPVIVNQGHSGKSAIVKDGETGLVIPHSAPEILAKAIVRLAQDHSLRTRLGKNGLSHSRLYFDAYKNTKRVEEVYETVLKSSRTRNQRERQPWPLAAVIPTK